MDCSSFYKKHFLTKNEHLCQITGYCNIPSKPSFPALIMLISILCARFSLWGIYIYIYMICQVRWRGLFCRDPLVTLTLNVDQDWISTRMLYHVLWVCLLQSGSTVKWRRRKKKLFALTNTKVLFCFVLSGLSSKELCERVWWLSTNPGDAEVRVRNHPETCSAHSGSTHARWWVFTFRTRTECLAFCCLHFWFDFGPACLTFLGTAAVHDIRQALLFPLGIFLSAWERTQTWTWTQKLYFTRIVV